MRLPPYGRLFQTIPRSGVRVAIGPDAWNFAKKHYYPIMVLPTGTPACVFKWPSDGGPALVHERGDYNDERLGEIGEALLRSGASSVVAIREALLDEYDPRVFYDKEVIRVAA